MDKTQEAANFPSLWIDWTEHIVSFHEEDGYERLDYAVEKCSNGFRIQ